MYTVCIDACRGSYYTNPLSMITDIVCVCVGIQCTCVHCVFVRQVITIAVKIIGEKTLIIIGTIRDLYSKNNPSLSSNGVSAC